MAKPIKRLLRRIILKAREALATAEEGSLSNFSKDLVNNPRAHFGEFTYGVPAIFEWGEGTELTVGKFCSIASYVNIFLGGGHRTDWVTTYPFNVFVDEFPSANGIIGHPISKGNVVIGNDVWIGQGATILSGVTIGDGAVIGAFSVVAKDVDPYTIVAGNPARLIRRRFDVADIEFLLSIKWWDWPKEKIEEHVRLLCSGNIVELRRALEL